MKKVKSFLLFLVLTCTTVLAQPVNHSQALGDLIPTKQWFEIEDYYQQHKDSIYSEFVKLWYIAETGAAFNRPLEAINAYERLIDNNLLNMDAMVLLSLFGQSALQLCADIQEYAKGVILCQKMIMLVERDSTIDSNTRITNILSLEQSIESFKLFPQLYPKPQIIKQDDNNKREVALIPNKSNNCIFFNANWNGIKLRTHFDTGAGACYIYNRAIAEKLGVKLNTTDTILMNDETIRGLVGIIDSLEFGEFTVKNIVVYVNIETIDHTDSLQVLCDSMLNSSFDIVLGMPVIKELGVIEFDFVKNTMTFPQTTKTTINYLRTCHKSGDLDKKSKYFKSKETESLKKYIEDKNLWKRNVNLKNYVSEGAEQKVYLKDGKSVIKLNDAIYYLSWIDYFINLILHNYFFPDTAYKLLGFFENDNAVYAVVEQHFISATEITDLQMVEQFMKINGFLKVRNNDYFNPELNIILEDLHDENVWRIAVLDALFTSVLSV